jgi:hypothetical protein
MTEREAFVIEREALEALVDRAEARLLTGILWTLRAIAGLIVTGVLLKTADMAMKLLGVPGWGY